MFCDGVDPGAFVEVWAREACPRKMQTAKQIADVRNRRGVGISVVSYFRSGRARKAGGIISTGFTIEDSAFCAGAVSATSRPWS
jgi:hypothetical protein